MGSASGHGLPVPFPSKPTEHRLEPGAALWSLAVGLDFRAPVCRRWLVVGVEGWLGSRSWKGLVHHLL